MNWSSFFQNFPQAVSGGAVLHMRFDLQNSTSLTPSPFKKLQPHLKKMHFLLLNKKNKK